MVAARELFVPVVNIVVYDDHCGNVEEEEEGEDEEDDKGDEKNADGDDANVEKVLLVLVAARELFVPDLRWVEEDEEDGYEEDDQGDENNEYGDDLHQGSTKPAARVRLLMMTTGTVRSLKKRMIRVMRMMMIVMIFTRVQQNQQPGCGCGEAKRMMNFVMMMVRTRRVKWMMRMRRVRIRRMMRMMIFTRVQQNQQPGCDCGEAKSRQSHPC